MNADSEFGGSSPLSDMRLAHRRQCLALAWRIHRVDEIPDHILTCWIDQLDSGKNPLDVYGQLIESTRRVRQQAVSSKAMVTRDAALRGDEGVRTPLDFKGNPALEALYRKLVIQISDRRRRPVA